MRIDEIKDGMGNCRDGTLYLCVVPDPVVLLSILDR
jgi:hypothetical protein